MSVDNSRSKISALKNNLTGGNNYVNYDSVINEKSSDNDYDNSIMNENDFHLNDPRSLYEREFRRFTIEYIKVLGIYQKEKKEGEINLKEIIKEYKIPKGIIEIEEEEEEEEKNKEQIEISEEESKEDKIGFDNDIQPMPSLNQEMKIIIYLSKPKIVVFDGKLGLFYISPPPVNKESEYYFIVKNPENMKITFKIKLLEIVTCFKKNENSLLFQNFSNKVLVKINHEMNFKNKEECSLIHQGITYLMNNKDDDILY